MKKLTTLTLIAIVAVSVTAHSQSAAWTANTQDKTLSGLVERWAQAEGRHAKWEAAADFPILDADGLNRAAKLTGATSMTNAVDGVISVSEQIVAIADSDKPQAHARAAAPTSEDGGLACQVIISNAGARELRPAWRPRHPGIDERLMQGR